MQETELYITLETEADKVKSRETNNKTVAWPSGLSIAYGCEKRHSFTFF